MRPIALYEPDGEKLNFYCRMCEPIIWQGKVNCVLVLFKCLFEQMMNSRVCLKSHIKQLQRQQIPL